MKLDFLNKNKPSYLDSKNKPHAEIFAQDQFKNIMNTMWEIRINKTINDENIGNSNSEEDKVMFKNVINGKFLYCENGSRLVLKYYSEKVDTEGFFFYIKMKNSWTSNNTIK